MRLRCPRCMTIVDARPSEPVVCPSCGFSSPAPSAAAPAPAPSAPGRWPSPTNNPPITYAPSTSPPPLPTAVPASVLNPNHGPVGKRRWPGTPILLGLVTLGIYTLVWYWKVSKEMDDFAQRPGHSNKRIRIGVFLYAAALIVLVIGFGALGSAGPAAFEEGTPAEELPAGPLVIFGLSFLVGLALLLAGYVLLVMGMWRMWKMMEQEDQRRLVPDPFNATMALVLFLLILVPYAGVILYMVALGLTQKGLNRIWDAYRQSGMPPMPGMAQPLPRGGTP